MWLVKLMNAILADSLRICRPKSQCTHVFSVGIAMKLAFLCIDTYILEVGRSFRLLMACWKMLIVVIQTFCKHGVLIS